MSNVVEFPNGRTQQSLSPDDYWASHVQRVRKSVAALESTTRGINEADRLAFAQNLGDLIEGRARDHGLGRNEALQLVWKKFDPQAEMWAKRLRYVRFRDEDKKGDILAGAGKHFVGLANNVSSVLPIRGVSEDRDLIEALARLTRGTAYDPDPAATARIDFDAARDLGELLDAASAHIVALVPELPEYFRRIETHGLLHPHSDEHNDHDPNIRPMQPHDDESWDTGVFWSPLGDGNPFYDIASPSNLHEGYFWDTGVGGVPLPRIVLGRISEVTRAASIPDFIIMAGSASHEAVLAAQGFGRPRELTDEELISRLESSEELLALISSPPSDLPKHLTIPLEYTHEVQMLLVPAPQNAKSKVGAGLFVPTLEQTFLGWRSRSAGRFTILEAEADNFRLVLALPGIPIPSRSSVIPVGHFGNTLFLLPGEASDHVLGLRHTASTGEFWFQPADAAISIDPNFVVPAGFAPQAATSLGGMMIRNLLYADGEANIVNQLAHDARSRVDRLEHQYRQWMTEYEAARNSFLDTSSKDDPA